MGKIYTVRSKALSSPGSGLSAIRSAIQAPQVVLGGDPGTDTELARADRFGHHLGVASTDAPQTAISTGPPAQLMMRQSLISSYGKLVSGKDKRQPLIVNYASNKPKTLEEALDHPGLLPGFNPEADLEIEHSDSTFSALIHGIEVGELTIYHDTAGAWINNIAVKDGMQGRGIGSRMVAAAAEEYGELYASSASKQEEDEQDDADDTRHLSVEGAALVASCIRKGIMKAEWCKNPYH